MDALVFLCNVDGNLRGIRRNVTTGEVVVVIVVIVLAKLPFFCTLLLLAVGML
jgi:hypothetical protein